MVKLHYKIKKKKKTFYFLKHNLKKNHIMKQTLTYIFNALNILLVCSINIHFTNIIFLSDILYLKIKNDR